MTSIVGPTDKRVSTGFSALSRRQARGALAVVVLVTLGCAAISLSPWASGFAGVDRGRPGDVALYRAVVDRVHGGEEYYAVLSNELITRGYPTASVFNWRTPLPLWLIAQMPDPVLGKALLCLLGLVTLLLAFEWLGREGGPLVAAVGVIAMFAAMFPCLLGELYVMPMLWAGVLIALSLCAYALDKRTLAVVAGLAAVFARDLALVYCLAMWLGALRQNRRGENVAWLVGLGLYGLFFARHAIMTTMLVAPDARAHAEGWIQLGGAAFLISLAQMNGFLLVLPQWVSAIYLPLAVLGFAAWKSPGGQRAALVVLLYLVAFAIVGQPFNQYWGSLLAPALALGFAWTPKALAELWRAARSARTRPLAAAT